MRRQESTRLNQRTNDMGASATARVREWVENNPDVRLVLEIAERGRTTGSFAPALSLEMAQKFMLNTSISQLPAI